MKIEQNFVFYTATVDFLSGVLSYTDSFVSAYAREFPQHKIKLHTNAKPELFLQCNLCENICLRPLAPKGRLPFKLTVLARLTQLSWSLRRARRALVSTTPFVSPFPFCLQYQTIHDLYDVDFEYRSWHNVVFFRVYYFLSRLFVERRIAVSDTTASLAVHYVDARARSILVLKEASKFPPSLENEVKVPAHSPKILIVCNVTLNKNFGAALDILLEARKRGMELTLYWVGQDRSGIAQEEISKRGGMAMFPNLNCLGSVDEDILQTLYTDADALLVTSWTEGFCLPVLEAQSKGCPVVASDIPVMREVAGEDSLFFPPENPAVGVDQIEFLLAEPNRLARRLSALENSRHFSWAKGARDLERNLSQ